MGFQGHLAIIACFRVPVMLSGPDEYLPNANTLKSTTRTKDAVSHPIFMFFFEFPQVVSLMKSQFNLKKTVYKID